MISTIDRFARIGISRLPKDRRSGRYAYNLLCLGGCLLAIGYTAFYLALGLPEMAIGSTLVFAVGVLPFIAIRSERLSIAIGILICCIGFGALSYLAGRDTLLHLYIILALLNLVILRGTRAPIETALGGLFTAAFAAFCHVQFETPALGARISEQFVLGVSTASVFLLGMLILAVMLVLTQQVRRAQNALAAEHARSEALLYNLLPEDIAQRLKERPGEVIADGLPAVTLLFADIVDFTPRSAARPPEEVVAFLNRVFSRFDELTAERGLEKIKTIGDAYMVAAGLPVARDDHAEIIADMALQMQAEAARLSDEMGEEVQLRVGIHSGPAIAGVIGTSKVFYDVWGDTVNTASRMESHGVPGRIQITGATRALLDDAFEVTSRGPVEIKGIGPLETWWLTGRRAAGAARACQ